jgi:acyl-coenzyme A synthetase/AMP-(fatty) acid ligase
MPQGDRVSLWTAARAAGDLSSRFVSGADQTVTLGDLDGGSILCGRVDDLRARSVLLATTDQLATALALVELDGIARRLILYPSDLPWEHLPFVIDSAEVDATVSDRMPAEVDAKSAGSLITCGSKVEPANCDRSVQHRTEWILFTSGTTRQPRMVVHTLESLAGAIQGNVVPASPVVWSTFYDIRRYGGLQIFLRAIFSRASLVLSSGQESTASFLARAGVHGVTHISGTPSHWRRALMSPAARAITPQYVRLSGEIADQAILDHLQSFYSRAIVAHAFASTEAGVAFEVRDGRAGFPASLVDQPTGDSEMKVDGGSLRIRSSRTAARYLSQEAALPIDTDGFIDTGDMLELRDNRYYFVGRRDGAINVGGLKVHPEEVEAVINRHPRVRMSLVRTRKNPITGGLVVADVVVRAEPDSTNEPAAELEADILQFCHKALPRHKVPATIRFVPALALAATGKMVRSHA